MGLDGTLQLRVSELADQRYSSLLILHELIEALLCKERGITTEQVDAWDLGEGADLDEPGDDPRAPYHLEHTFASAMERLLAHEFGVEWSTYGDAVDGLFRPDDK